MKYIVFDTETTGLKPGQIAQISYTILDMETRKAKAKNFFFTVSSMDPNALKTHHLSMNMLKELSGGELFEDRAEEILNDFSGKVLVGHNVSFDIRFLNHELSQLQMYMLEQNSFCTMKHFTDIMRLPTANSKGFKRPKLEELVSFLGITPKEIEAFALKLFGGFTGYHDARYDVAATALVFLNGFKAGYIKDAA